MNTKVLYLLLPLLFLSFQTSISFRYTRQDELNEQFIEAAVEGSTEQITAFLKSGADVNARSKNMRHLGNTALNCAAEKGHLNCILLLLKENAQVNDTNSMGKTALHHAAEYGHAAIVKALINANANVDSQGGLFSNTALQLAAANGNATCIPLLLAAKADLGFRSRSSSTAFHLAVRRDHLNCVKELVKYSYLLVPPAEVVDRSRRRVFSVLLSFLRFRNLYPKLENLRDATLQYEILSWNTFLEEDLVIILLDELKKGKKIKNTVLIRSKDSAVRYLLKAIGKIASQIQIKEMTPSMIAFLAPTRMGDNLDALVREGLNERIEELKSNG